MNEGVRIGVVTAVAITGVLLAVAVPVVSAQSDASSRSTAVLEGVDVSIAAGPTTRVDATYRFTGLGDSARGVECCLNGTLWSFENQSVSRLAVRVDGRPVDHRGSHGPRHRTIGVPVSGRSDVVVRLTYTVSSTGHRTNVPLWVPRVETAGTDQAVSISVVPSRGGASVAVVFPTADARTDGGRETRLFLRRMPGFVAVTSGSGQLGPGRVPLGPVLGSVLGLVVVVRVATSRSDSTGEYSG